MLTCDAGVRERRLWEGKLHMFFSFQTNMLGKEDVMRLVRSTGLGKNGHAFGTVGWLVGSPVMRRVSFGE